jgi:hypothetical protein
MNGLDMSIATFDVLRGEVMTRLQDGTVGVLIEGSASDLIRCALLSSGLQQNPGVAIGDRVLVCRSRSDESHVILGVLNEGASFQADQSHVEEEVPEEILLEARHSLTLRVGDGSITIREDGKILIKGKDLVSHATRRNRIKGGSVEIN